MRFELTSSLRPPCSAGTFILGLSWLIGTTMQEILASIIFLFIKHPYDVGDRVSIDAVDYIVLEMHLLSSIFKKVDGTVTQAPHSLLNTKFLLKCVPSLLLCSSARRACS